jgi:hypothetical protein
MVVMGRVSAEGRRREDKDKGTHAESEQQNINQCSSSNKMGDIAVPEECHPEKEQRWNI